MKKKRMSGQQNEADELRYSWEQWAKEKEKMIRGSAKKDLITATVLCIISILIMLANLTLLIFRLI